MTRILRKEEGYAVEQSAARFPEAAAPAADFASSLVTGSDLSKPRSPVPTVV